MTTEPLDQHNTLGSTAPEGAKGPFGKLLDSRVGRLIKFGLVGGSGVIVNLLVFKAVYMGIGAMIDPLTPTHHTIANFAGVVVSIFTNFLLNDSWTWGDRIKGGGGAWVRRIMRYYATCSIAAGIQILTASLAFTYLLEPLQLEVFGIKPAPELAVMVGIVVGIAINFPISHVWAFKDEASIDVVD